jgi:hypothetical protein
VEVVFGRGTVLGTYRRNVSSPWSGDIQRGYSPLVEESRFGQGVFVRSLSFVLSFQNTIRTAAFFLLSRGNWVRPLFFLARGLPSYLWASFLDPALGSSHCSPVLPCGVWTSVPPHHLLCREGLLSGPGGPVPHSPGAVLGCPSTIQAWSCARSYWGSLSLGRSGQVRPLCLPSSVCTHPPI